MHSSKVRSPYRLLAIFLAAYPLAALASAPTIDTANVIKNSASISSGTTSFSVTVAASDNLLLFVEGMDFNSGAGHAPDTVTYNGVALTELNSYAYGGQQEISIWYLSSPPSGSHTLSATWTTNTNVGRYAQIAIPMSGAAASSIFGTVATATSTSNNNPAVTTTGGSSNSLYFGITYNFIATTASSATGQSDILAVNSIQGFNQSFDSSNMAGTGSGAMAWAGSGTSQTTHWGAMAVNINGSSGSGPPPSQFFLGN